MYLLLEREGGAILILVKECEIEILSHVAFDRCAPIDLTCLGPAEHQVHELNHDLLMHF